MCQRFLRGVLASNTALAGNKILIFFERNVVMSSKFSVGFSASFADVSYLICSRSVEYLWDDDFLVGWRVVAFAFVSFQL